MRISTCWQRCMSMGMCILLISTLLHGGSPTQSPSVQQEWERRYPASDVSFNCRLTAMAQDVSGNLYLTGYTDSSTFGNNYLTVKYNSAGELQWARQFNGTANFHDQATAIAVDDNGNVYVTGQSFGSNYDFATVKYNPNGSQEWVAIYDGSARAEDRPVAIALDSQGNVIVTGECKNSGTGFDFVTIKYNSSGVQQWVRTYNNAGTADDNPSALAIDPAGNVYITGVSKGGGTADYAVVKYDKYGTQQWVAVYNGSGNSDDNPYAIAVSAEGDIFITGESKGSTGKFDIVTVKYNANGTLQWEARYNGSGNLNDGGCALAVGESGNVYVGGYCYNGLSSLIDFVTIKYGTNGTELWAAGYSSTGLAGDYVRDLTLDAEENVYITGVSQSPTCLKTFMTIKYNADGIEQWRIGYEGAGSSGNDPVAIAVDQNGNIYIAGQSSYPGTNDYYSYYTLVKYKEVGTHNIEEVGIKSYRIDLSVFPNPFNATAAINFSIPTISKVHLAIYDLLGHEVKVLLNNEMTPGYYQFDWDGSGVSAGVYICVLRSEFMVISRKMVILK